MRDDEARTGDRSFPYDDSLVLNTRLSEIERQQREDKETERKHNRSQLRTNRLIAAFTGLLFVTSIVSDTILFRQTKLTEESAEAASTAARAASDQVTLMKQQLEAATGAVLHFSHPFPIMLAGSDGHLIINFSNLGNSMATDIRAMAKIALHGVPGNKIVKQFSETTVPISNLGPARVNDPNSMVNKFQWDSLLPLNASEARDIEEGRDVIATTLTLSYNNGFRIITDGDCYAYMRFAIEIRKAPNGSVESAGYDRNIPCAQLPNEMTEMYTRRLDAEKRREEAKRDSSK